MRQTFSSDEPDGGVLACTRTSGLKGEDSERDAKDVEKSLRVVLCSMCACFCTAGELQLKCSPCIGADTGASTDDVDVRFTRAFDVLRRAMPRWLLLGLTAQNVTKN